MLIVCCGVVFIAMRRREVNSVRTSSLPSSSPPPAIVDSAVVKGFNAFGIELLKKQTPQGNVILSPGSLAVLLSLTANGAAQNTRAEILQTLGVKSVPEEQLSKACHNLMTNWNSSSSLYAVNSLWIQDEKRIEPDYIDSATKSYDAEINYVDFQSSETPNTLNNWMKNKTDGKTEGMRFWNVGSNTVLVLLNTLYFKSPWATKFDKGSTQNKDFHLDNAQTAHVPMMSVAGAFPHYAGKDVELIKMSYLDRAYAFYILLPKKGQTLENLLARMKNEDWEKWMRNLHSAHGQVFIPRLKLDGEPRLNEALVELGIRDAFDSSESDFSRACPDKDFYVSMVTQKAMMEVDEEGTRATASTQVEMKRESDGPDETSFNFIADRPFLAALRDENSGAILFWCVVRNPASS